MGIWLPFILSLTMTVYAQNDQGKKFRVVDGVIRTPCDFENYKTGFLYNDNDVKSETNHQRVAHSLRHDRILVDANGNRFDASYATRTSPLGLWIPAPHLLSFKNGAWKKTSLPDWERIKKMIVSKATARSKTSMGVDERTLDNAKAFLTGRDSASYSMSGNGRFAFVNLQFRSVYYLPYTEHAGSQSPRLQNWFGLWDLEKNKLIKEWNSTDLDGGGQRELQPEDIRDESYASPFERQLAARMLSDGTVIVVRNLEHHVSREEAYVSTRVMVVKTDGQVEFLNDLTPTYVKKDPGWSGTRNLRILRSPESGAIEIMSDIADLGVRMFEVISLAIPTASKPMNDRPHFHPGTTSPLIGL